MSRNLEAALEYVAMNTTVPQWVISLVTAPVDMILFCPHCNTQHIDAPEAVVTLPAKFVKPGTMVRARPEWTNPPHRTHLCRLDQGGCGWMWRPADVATNGVLHLASRHRLEMTAPHWELMAAKRYQETHIDPPPVLIHKDYPLLGGSKMRQFKGCGCTMMQTSGLPMPPRCPVHDEAAHIAPRYRDYPYPNSAGELTKTQRLFPCCCTVINREQSALPERCPVHDARL